MSMDVPPEAAELAADFVRRNAAEISSLAKNLLRNANERVRLNLPNTYREYLTVSGEKYGRAKSFFFRSNPTNIYDFYVPLSITVGNEIISNVNYSKVIKHINRGVVTGPAGSGKSILMRHFFLSALSEARKAPIFVELRNLNTTDLSVRSLILKSLRANRFSMSESYVSKALERGHFALLLDGYDEIAYSKRPNVGQEILDLAQDAAECIIVISSRPDDIFSGWEDFSLLKLNPLNLNEAIELVKKLPHDEEIKNKFMRDLKEELFQEHESFLSNPLLLSIMLLTYGISADIPKKLSIFYNQAYEALFQRHDAVKGGFQRDRRCTLDIQDFSRVFGAFCVQTYDKRIFQFSRSDGLSYIERAKRAVDITVGNDEFLEDALQSVCLLVEDGLLLAFSHRSFQEYFVAKFISEASPRTQKQLINRFWYQIDSDNVISLLYEINPELVERELLIPKLNDLFKKIDVKRKIGITHVTRFAKSQFDAIRSNGDIISYVTYSRGVKDRPFSIVRFVAWEVEPTFGRVISETYLDKEREFVAKYFSKPETEIEISEMTHRSQFMKDLISSSVIISVPFLESLYEKKIAMEEKHKRVTTSLDALLSER